MEVDNWQIDINATESSTKEASELEKLWTATAEAAGGSITVRLWKWHQERTIKQFVCTWSHYILDFFGGNLCRNCGATHTQHDRRRYRFSQQGTMASNSDVLILIWASSDSQCTLDRQSQMKPKKKYDTHTVFFAMLPQMRLSNTCRRIKKQDGRSAARRRKTVSLRWSSADGSYSFWIVEKKSGDGMFYTTTRLKNGNQQLRLPGHKLHPRAPRSFIDPSVSHAESHSLAASELFYFFLVLLL